MIVHAHIIRSIQSLVPFLIIVNIPFTNVNITDLPSPTLCVHNTSLQLRPRFGYVPVLRTSLCAPSFIGVTFCDWGLMIKDGLYYPFGELLLSKSLTLPSLGMVDFLVVLSYPRSLQVSPNYPEGILVTAMSTPCKPQVLLETWSNLWVLGRRLGAQPCVYFYFDFYNELTYASS